MKALMPSTITAAVFAMGFSLNTQGATINPIYSTDFTSGTGGFTEGADLDDNAAWSAQPSWTTTDVNGAGFTGTSSGFHLAISTDGSFSMAVGQKKVLQMTMSILGDWGLASNVSVLRFGLDDTTDSGAAEVVVGSGLFASEFDDALRLRDPNYTAPGVAAFSWADAHDGAAALSDELNWTVTITKTATADTFEVVSSLVDTEGANQGAASATFTIVDSGLYNAATLYPVVQAGGFGDGVTGIRLNSFVVGVLAAPEPSTLGLFLMGGLLVGAKRFRSKN